MRDEIEMYQKEKEGKYEFFFKENEIRCRSSPWASSSYLLLANDNKPFLLEHCSDKENFATLFQCSVVCILSQTHGTFITKRNFSKGCSYIEVSKMS